MMLRFMVIVVVTATGYKSKLGSAVEVERMVKTARARVAPITLLHFREMTQQLRGGGGQELTRRDY